MSDTDDGVAPYGTWPSPISDEMVAGADVDFGHTALDGETLYWREQRPEQDGQGVVVRHDGESSEDVTPEDTNVRTLVHEYGGGDFGVHDGVVFFVRFDDQRVYRQSPDSDPVAITPEPVTERGLRYADFEISDDGNHVYCVREDHDAATGGNAADEPVTSLVRLAADGDEDPRVVASGNDFYAAPELSPAGDRLAWLTWDHPRMPWDGTELHVADVATDGTLRNERIVMGGPDESVFQPAWRPDGTLHAVSDRTGWWNLYQREGDEWVAYREEEAEYGVPQWWFGLATYVFFDDGRVAAVVHREGEQTLDLLDPDGTRETADLPYAVFGGSYGLPRLRSDGTSLYLLATGPATPEQLVRWTPGEDPVVLTEGSDVEVEEGYISTPDHVIIPTRDGKQAYAYFYPPTNPDVEPHGGELPPLVVFAHGGPTGGTKPTFNLSIQYFTSRGFALADVNYRGSTGYGRTFRETLHGEWGNIDVEDCIDTAHHLSAEGQVEGDRLAIRGGSAGGFIVLSALAFHDEFDAGTSSAGVADIERLYEATHKFESEYVHQLIGADPDKYKARSPVYHADGIGTPLLLLQGEDDPVVPLSQAEAMGAALDDQGVPYELLVFEDEQHSFRRAESRQRAIGAELAFYGEVFDFEPSDELPALDMSGI